MTPGPDRGREWWLPMSFVRTVLLIVVLLVGWMAVRGGIHFPAAAGTPVSHVAP